MIATLLGVVVTATDKKNAVGDIVEHKLENPLERNLTGHKGTRTEEHESGEKIKIKGELQLRIRRRRVSSLQKHAASSTKGNQLGLQRGPPALGEEEEKHAV
jgi:hypothetical protein